MFLPLLCAGRSLFPPTPHAAWRAGYQTRLRRRDKSRHTVEPPAKSDVDHRPASSRRPADRSRHRSSLWRERIERNCIFGSNSRCSRRTETPSAARRWPGSGGIREMQVDVAFDRSKPRSSPAKPARYRQPRRRLHSSMPQGRKDCAAQQLHRVRWEAAAPDFAASRAAPSSEPAARRRETETGLRVGPQLIVGDSAAQG